MSELWLPIREWENFYEVSNFGRVRSLSREIPCGRRTRLMLTCIMANQENGNGYRYIFLKRDGLRYKRFVHRLVAEAFIPNPAGVEIVNHKDYNRSHNAVWNLEWMTPSENVRHGYVRIQARKEEPQPIEEIAKADLPFL